MRKLATIQIVRDITPIKEADRIELVHVLGWQVVCPKDQFQPGDYCVYFEIDSFLPIAPEYEFLRSSSYKNDPIMGEGFLLRTKKMSGEISQGLCMPISIVEEKGWHGLPEGTDVTKLLGVRKWEMPKTTSNAGTIIGKLPASVHKTDEMRIQAEPGLLEEFRGLPYYITTKLDGSSHSISIDPSGFHVTGHNFEYKDDGRSGFYEYIKEKDLETKMRMVKDMENLQTLTVQGEWCGRGIQKNRLKLMKPHWFIFTIDIDGKRCGLRQMERIAIRLGLNLDLVPIVEEGFDLPGTYPTIDDLLIRASQDNTKIYQGGEPEGIVIRPQEPVYSQILQGPLSMKVINNKYLLKA